MNVGIRPSEAEELFELFDTDASGGIDDKEFMKALFPDDYRRIYMRTTTATMTFAQGANFSGGGMGVGTFEIKADLSGMYDDVALLCQ